MDNEWTSLVAFGKDAGFVGIAQIRLLIDGFDLEARRGDLRFDSGGAVVRIRTELVDLSKAAAGQNDRDRDARKQDAERDADGSTCFFDERCPLIAGDAQRTDRAADSVQQVPADEQANRKSTRLNSSHVAIS